MRNTESSKETGKSILQEYRKFIRQVDIRDVRVVAARMDVIDRDYYPSSSLVSWTVDAEYEPTGDGFNVLHRYRVRVRNKGSKQDKARISVTFLVTYTSKIAVNDELFDVFRERNLPINTWPYFREFVHNSLMRMGWPPFIAPVFRR